MLDVFGGEFFLFAFHAHGFELALFASWVSMTSDWIWAAASYQRMSTA
jgi:hypothetical protein